MAITRHSDGGGNRQLEPVQLFTEDWKGCHGITQIRLDSRNLLPSDRITPSADVHEL